MHNHRKYSGVALAHFLSSRDQKVSDAPVPRKESYSDQHTESFCSLMPREVAARIFSGRDLTFLEIALRAASFSNCDRTAGSESLFAVATWSQFPPLHADNVSGSGFRLVRC
jgi:hypothetical protein